MIPLPTARLFRSFLPLLVAGCAIVPPDGDGPAPDALFDSALTDPTIGGPLEVRAIDRTLVTASSGERLLRIRFSYRAYEGWIDASDVHRASGAVYFPADDRGRADPSRYGPVVLTEYPPGTSSTGFAFHAEYGERIAADLDLAAAVVDVRGPIARDLRFFANPEGGTDETFRSEAQFALSMLAEYQKSGDAELLHEAHVARAWIRALDAVDLIVRDETDAEPEQYLLVGQDYGAVGAIRAAASVGLVAGLAITGWPLDRLDLETVRTRRWEWEKGVDLLDVHDPIPWADHRQLASFLGSSWARPDPECPSCLGSGESWRAQFEYVTLRRRGQLDGVRTLVLAGDADPRFPIDLEARASLLADGRKTWLGGPLGGGSAPPHPTEVGRGLYDGVLRAQYLGARIARTPFEDLRYLPGRSTLAQPEAAEAVRAWAQHLLGSHDVPAVVVHEAIVDGVRRFDVAVREGNAPVLGVEFRTLDVGERDAPDYKSSLRSSPPEPVPWRKLSTRYVGHDPSFTGWWRAETPMLPGRDYAWRLSVRTRVGDVATTHDFPVIPVRTFGDPAGPPRRQ